MSKISDKVIYRKFHSHLKCSLVFLLVAFVFLCAPQRAFGSTRIGTDISTEGLLGVGLSSPSAQLDIKTASASALAKALSLTNSNNSPLMLVAADGKVGFGISDPSTLNENLEVRRTVSSATGNTYGIRSTFNIDMPTNSYQWAAMLAEAIIPSGNSSNFTGLVRGGYNYLRHDGSGTLSEGVGNYSIIRGNNSSTITNAYEYAGNTQISGTSSIGTLVHYYAFPAVKNGSGTIGTEIGLYVGNMTSGSTRYAILTAGTSPSLFGGNVNVSGNLEMNGSAQMKADGTAALPGFATAGNANMGMFRASNNVLGFSTVGTEKMRIDASGNVGIGTTPQGQKLEINGGMRLNTATSKPTCDATTRGTQWFTQGSSGVKDSLEVCAKDAGDAYAWRTLY